MAKQTQPSEMNPVIGKKDPDAMGSQRRVTSLPGVEVSQKGELELRLLSSGDTTQEPMHQLQGQAGLYWWTGAPTPPL